MTAKKNSIISEIREKILDIIPEYTNNSIQIIINVPPNVKKADTIQIEFR